LDHESLIVNDRRGGLKRRSLIAGDLFVIAVVVPSACFLRSALVRALAVERIANRRAALLRRVAHPARGVGRRIARIIVPIRWAAHGSPPHSNATDWTSRLRRKRTRTRWANASAQAVGSTIGNGDGRAAWRRREFAEPVSNLWAVCRSGHGGDRRASHESRSNFASTPVRADGSPPPSHHHSP